MALNIISDHAANLAHRNLARAEEAANRSLAKLSSGKRVVSARDDAASMAIGSRLNSTATSLTAGIVNIGQGNSMLQIADGAMVTIDDVLVRMNTLAVQAASENLSDTERGFLNDEFVALRTEINRIAAATNFNGIQLLGDGSDVSLDYSDLQAGGSAEVLSVANGFSNFTITDDNYWARDANDNGSADNQLRFDLLKTGDRILLSAISEIDGTSPHRTQSIDITDYASGGSKALNAGQTQTLDFEDVGVNVNLNFNIATTITNALAQGSDGAGADGSATAQILAPARFYRFLRIRATNCLTRSISSLAAAIPAVRSFRSRRPRLMVPPLVRAKTARRQALMSWAAMRLPHPPRPKLRSRLWRARLMICNAHGPISAPTRTVWMLPAKALPRRLKTSRRRAQACLISTLRWK